MGLGQCENSLYDSPACWLLGFESEPGFGSSGQIVDTEGDEAESLEKTNSLKHFENF